jgi:hypothetical protein
VKSVPGLATTNVNSVCSYGPPLPLDAIAADLHDRLISIFTRGPDGLRPCFGRVERLQTDPAVQKGPEKLRN